VTGNCIDASEPRENPRGSDDVIKAVAVRKVGPWIVAVLLLALVAFVLRALIATPNIRWSAIGHFQFSSAIIGGLLVTLELTASCLALGIVLGVGLAVLRRSSNLVSRAFSWFYIWLFRGTPVVVQLIFWYNLGLLFPHIGLGDLRVSTNHLITPFTAAVLGLGLNEGAYMAEIVRAGIEAVDPGQTEAGLSLGLKRGAILRLIVLPQAMRIIIPPTGNQLISLLKTTSLVAFIAGGDLLTVAQNIYSRNFLVIELLIVVSIWYLAATSLATAGQFFIERRFARGTVSDKTDRLDEIARWARLRWMRSQ
jgi:polar amino acid transport system permease protein